MKSSLRKIFAFILSPLEAGDEPYAIKPSHRYVLQAIGGLFALLASIVFVIILRTPDADPGYYTPVVVFYTVAILALIVGFLGNDRAVAKIWGNK